MAKMCGEVISLKLHLYLSANGDDECNVEAQRLPRRLPIDSNSLTKVEETVGLANSNSS